MRCRLAVVLSLAVMTWVTAGMAEGKKADAARPQWRALWVDAFNSGIRTPAEVDQLVADLKSLNCNTVFAQVRKRGDAYFRKTIDPFTDDPVVPAEFDPLEYLLEKAHKEGIQVHAWINPMPIWKADQEPPKDRNHLYHRHGPETKGRDNWLTCNEKGETKYPVGYFLDAGHPDVHEHLIKVVTDLVKNYPVDGVHLDYIRYPETLTDTEQTGYGVGYNAVSVERFNRVHGRKGIPERNEPLWKDWRRQQLTQLVRRLRVALLETNPKVLLSAALIPWGDGPADEASWVKTAPYNRVFQDWHNWRREGLLDLTVPMNYDRESRAEHAAFFDHWIAFEKTHRYRSRLIIGLGAYLNTIPQTEAQLRRALAASEKVPAPDGICFFSYAWFRGATAANKRPTLEELCAMLTQGADAPFAQPAPVPKLPRVDEPMEGTIAGWVMGAQPIPLDSQQVRIEPLDGRDPFPVRTDGNGFFAAVALKPGRYRVIDPMSVKRVEVEVVAGKVVTLWKPGGALGPPPLK